MEEVLIKSTKVLAIENPTTEIPDVHKKIESYKLNNYILGTIPSFDYKIKLSNLKPLSCKN